MTKVLVIGAGWLGRPLANHFASLRYPVLATNRQLNPLQSDDFLPLALDLSQEIPDSFVNQIIDFAPDVIIGCFPPGFRHQSAEERHLNPYRVQWQRVCHLAKRCHTSEPFSQPLVVMISSTAVYPDELKIAMEEDATLIAKDLSCSDKSQKLLIAEQEVIDSGCQYLILRCAGLIGPNRHPARFVSKMKSVSDAAPVNMVHLRDVIGAITHCIDWISGHRNKPGEVFNITCPNTCSKAHFYQQALKSMPSDTELPPISNTPSKRIVCQKLLSTGYPFIYSDVLDAMRAIDS